jgi:hypothetical protein
VRKPNIAAALALPAMPRQLPQRISHAFPQQKNPSRIRTIRVPLVPSVAVIAG